MIVLDPSMDLYRDLVHFLVTDERIATFSFPDQDLLTTVFHDKWVALPWYYNALKTLRNAHSQLWDDDVVRCVHYILTDKPWQSRTSGKDFEVVNGWWWDQFTRLGEEMQVADADGWRLVSTLVAK
jgi:lipopolysaccharide biosynthesis glycosyltransferase